MTDQNPNPLVQEAQKITLFPDEPDMPGSRAQGGVMPREAAPGRRNDQHQLVTPDNEVIGVPAGTQPVPDVGEQVAPAGDEDPGYDNVPDMDAVMRMFGPPLPRE